MEFELSDVTPADLVAVLALNESEVPQLGIVNIEQMRWFSSNATYFRIAKTDGQLAAFLVGLRPGTDYGSLNYRWFCDRYEEFAYVDRVAVATFARRHGLASRLYDDFAAAIPGSVNVMTCEVNIRPPNDESMRFHTRLGFSEVGTLVTDSGGKEVALLLKELR